MTMTDGKSVLLEDGRRGVAAAGKAAVFGDPCSECCTCTTLPNGSYIVAPLNMAGPFLPYFGCQETTPATLPPSAPMSIAGIPTAGLTYFVVHKVMIQGVERWVGLEECDFTGTKINFAGTTSAAADGCASTLGFVFGSTVKLKYGADVGLPVLSTEWRAYMVFTDCFDFAGFKAELGIP